jgi:hypothetical protein
MPAPAGGSSAQGQKTGNFTNYHILAESSAFLFASMETPAL